MNTKDSALKTICKLVEKISLRDAEIEQLKDKNKCQQIDLEKLMKADEVVCANNNVIFPEYNFNNSSRDGNPTNQANPLYEINDKLVCINNHLKGDIKHCQKETIILQEYNEKLRDKSDRYKQNTIRLQKENNKLKESTGNLTKELAYLNASCRDEFNKKLKDADYDNEKLKVHNTELCKEVEKQKEVINYSLKEKCDLWKWSDMQYNAIENMKVRSDLCTVLVELLSESIKDGDMVSEKVYIAIKNIETVVPILYSELRKPSHIFNQLQNQIFERMGHHYFYVKNKQLGGVPAHLDYLRREDMFEMAILMGDVKKYKIGRELVECSQSEFEQELSKI